MTPRSLCAFILLGSLAAGQDFTFPDFASIVNLTLNGSAAQATTPSGTVLRVVPSVLSSSGSGYNNSAMPILNGFETTFVFQTSTPSGQGADGLTFIIQNDSNALTALGKYAAAMGYGAFLSDPPGTAIQNSLVVELDTYFSATWGDTSHNEISIHTNGATDNSQSEAMSLGSVTPAVNMSDGLAHTLQIRYLPGSPSTIEISLDSALVLSVDYDFNTGGTHFQSGSPVGGLNLMPGGTAWVGFTAGTGGYSENYDVLSWQWTTTSGAVAVPLSDFECQTAGTTVPSGAPDCEGWQSVGGLQITMPNSIAQTCQPPGSGQWCEVTPATTGPALPLAPACIGSPGACGGVQPPAPGTASEMRLSTTVPVVAAGGQIRFHVDWYWFTSELPGSALYNDFAQVALVDPGTGNVAETALRVDTNSNLAPTANTCVSGFSNLIYPQAYGPPQTATVIVPAFLHGNPVEISVLSANQGDASYDSVLWVDNLEWEVFPPGTVPPPIVGPGQPCGSLSMVATPFVAGSIAMVSTTGAPAGAAGFLYAGAVNPTPFFFLPGCEVVVSFIPPPIQVPIHFSTAGQFFLPLTVPTGTAGLQFAMQAVALDPLMLLGLNLSNGLNVTVGL